MAVPVGIEDRLLGRVAIGLFLGSTAFPVTAAVLPQAREWRPIGIADVIVAAVLVGVVITLVTRTRQAVTDHHRLAAHRAAATVTGIIPLLLATFFLVGQRVEWSVLVIGLSWRGWLLLQALPAIVASQSVAPTRTGPTPRQ